MRAKVLRFCLGLGFFEFFFVWFVLVFGFFHCLFVQTSRVENKDKMEGVKESQQEAQYLFTISNS